MTTSNAVATATAERIVACLNAADYPTLVDLYAPDALLDINLPTWRFQREGADDARQYFDGQIKGLTNLRCTELRQITTEGSVVVESECRFDGEDGEYLWRSVDIFAISNGEITEHTQYCTGCWTPDDTARQAAEAPMVRW